MPKNVVKFDWIASGKMPPGADSNLPRPVLPSRADRLAAMMREFGLSVNAYEAGDGIQRVEVYTSKPLAEPGFQPYACFDFDKDGNLFMDVEC